MNINEIYNKRRVKKTKLKKIDYDCNGAPSLEWIVSDEIIATIAECTHTLRSDVENVLDCYQMLLYEALIRGFSVNLPEIGYFTNKYMPAKEGTYNFGEDQNGEYSTPEYNKPKFYFHTAFSNKMRALTSNNPYDFSKNGMKGKS